MHPLRSGAVLRVNDRRHFRHAICANPRSGNAECMRQREQLPPASNVDRSRRVPGAGLRKSFLRPPWSGVKVAPCLPVQHGQPSMSPLRRHVPQGGSIDSATKFLFDSQAGRAEFGRHNFSRGRRPTSIVQLKKLEMKLRITSPRPFALDRGTSPRLPHGRSGLHPSAPAATNASPSPRCAFAPLSPPSASSDS